MSSNQISCRVIVLLIEASSGAAGKVPPQCTAGCTRPVFSIDRRVRRVKHPRAEECGSAEKRERECRKTCEALTLQVTPPPFSLSLSLSPLKHTFCSLRPKALRWVTSPAHLPKNCFSHVMRLKFVLFFLSCRK